jgi:CRP-like cAMP-binding protein
VHLLSAGQVRCFSLSEDGCEATTAVLGPGQLVGIAGLFGSLSHALFAQALTPTQTWVMPTAALQQEIRHNSMWQGLLVGALAQRVAVAEGLLRDVLLLPVRDRLGDVQLRLSATLGGTRPALSRSQLAGLVQARPETLTRVTPTHQGTPQQAAVHRPRLRAFRAGEVLDTVDAPRGYVNQLVDGQLQIALAGVDKRQVSVHTLNAGALIGVAGLVGLPPSGLRALALTDGTLRTLGAGELLGAIDADPARLLDLATKLGEGLLHLERQLSIAATRTARQRVVACLRDLERQTPEGNRLVSHASLAQRIGSSRETVTRALRVLEQDGVITRDGRRVHLSAAMQDTRPGMFVVQSTRQQGQHRRRVHEATRNPHDQARQLLVVEG